MRRLRAAVVRIGNLLRRGRLERELAAEMEGHLQLHIDDNISAGMTPVEARRQAILALGGLEQTKERYRERRGLPWLETLLQDLRFGARMLRRQPTFAVVAVLTLAVGFGPPIAIFALANWMVLRPVPGVADSGDVSYYVHGTPSPRGGTTIGRISHLNLRDLSARLRTLRVTGAQPLTNVIVGGNGRPGRYTTGQYVSPTYFDVLGVAMQAGRALGTGDDNPGHPPMVAVLSDGLWASLFDRDPGAVGKLITVNGHSFTVVGVAARGFQGATRFQADALWLPGATETIVRPVRGLRADDRATGGYYRFYGRLMPGATWPQADAELAAATAWLIDQYPTENARLKPMAFHNQGRIDALGRERLGPMMAVMFGVSALVLLIASSNVASLVLMRGIGRRDEVAVRKALGAGRGRVLRQHLTEAALLWLCGGAGGALIVWGVIQTGITTRLTLLGVPDLEVPFDWQVVGFALALALGVGLMFSMIPAWKATGVAPGVTIQAAAATATRRFRTGPVLTVVQLSASLALLIGALMLGATLRNLLVVDLGFEPDNVTTVRVQPAAGVSDAAAYAYMNEFRERLAARPGIAAVVMAEGAPFAGGFSAFMQVRRDAADTFVERHMHQVLSPDYFAALRIRLLRGRSFTPAEIPRPGGGETPAVVLSESLARELFGSIDVVGRTVQIPAYQQAPRTYPIVGVAADVRYASLTDEAPRTLYNPAGLGGFQRGTTMIAVASSSAPVMPDIQSVAESLGTPVPRNIMTLTEAIARARVEWDVLTWLLTALAAIASIVAAVGVYGVVAFAAASRRGEYGIRMALGASTGVVRRQVLRDAAIMAGAGLLFGTGGALGLLQVLRSRLVGVSPTEPAIWIVAAVILVALVTLASLIPAREAARASLAETLRAI
jgi:predicted permease